MDPIELARALVQRPSVTPRDEGALDALGAALEPLGFTLHRLRFGETENLVAHRRGTGRRLAFAGHTDVVPAGPAGQWSAPPFAGALMGGALLGRGAVDMKGAIAAFTAAAARRAAAGASDELLFLITGDEEGEALDGTVRLMPWLEANGLLPEATLVGEPTSQTTIGDMIKNGRRGSTNMWLTVEGVQGHVAYPSRADNPVTRLARIIAALKAEPLDEGTPDFEPSNLEVVAVEAGEGTATNVIPGAARARLNIRFNTLHSGESLEAWVRSVAAAHADRFTLEARCSGEAFLTEPCALSELLSDAVAAVTGTRPAFSTGGGTSDARFIRRYCPVLELGLVGTTMHKVDEAAPVADILRLTDIYAAFLDRWFG